MIKPLGFFKQFLETQMEGLTGHIGEAGYPFDIVQWGEDDFQTSNRTPNWWVYEQTAYWLDGFLKTSILLDNKAGIEKASNIIYKVINNPDEESYLGNQIIKRALGSRWPHVVFFRSCLALYEYNNDEKIIEALTNHYIKGKYQYRFFRDVFNVEIMLRLYEINKNEELLKLAKESYESYNYFKIRFNQINDNSILSRRRPYVHGVTYNEYSKLGALFYRVTKDKKYLKVSEKAFKTLNENFLLPGQCNCSNEFTTSNYYYECYETCDISDYSWANNYLLTATKKSQYGDSIVRCVFNAGIGSVLENFKGLQYFSCANQFYLDKYSNHNKFSRGKKWMSYRPNPGTECCAGNVNRFMPNYVRNMYYIEKNNIYLNLFGASEFTTKLNGKDIQIIQKTKFPFEESFELNIKTEKSFNLFIRIPKYAAKAEYFLNGEKVTPIKDSDYAKIKIVENCSVFCKIESEIKEITTSKNGVYFIKGPLVYSYGMYGRREIDHDEERSSAEFPAYNIYPDKEIGFELKKDLNLQFYQGSAEIFNINEDLSYIEIDAFKIKDLKVKEKKSIVLGHVDLFGKKRKEICKGKFLFTPDLLKGNYDISNEPTRIKLYPYGACKIRQTVFKKH